MTEQPVLKSEAILLDSEGYVIVKIEHPRIFHIKTQKSSCWTINNFITSEKADTIFEMGSKLPLVVHPECKIYGKVCHQNRSVGFFSNVSDGYKYSGQKANPISLIDYPWLSDIMNSINLELGTSFNGILINLYQDGSETIGAHSDDEKGLSNGTVASLSFGASRIFRIRPKINSDSTTRVDLKTEHGQLLVMDGDFQKEYTHEIPRETKIKKPRLSLTFRCHTY